MSEKQSHTYYGCQVILLIGLPLIRLYQNCLSPEVSWNEVIYKGKIILQMVKTIKVDRSPVNQISLEKILAAYITGLFKTEKEKDQHSPHTPPKKGARTGTDNSQGRIAVVLQRKRLSVLRVEGTLLGQHCFAALE